MSLARLEIAVVGAGIGGLATALALHRASANVVIYERAASLSEVGQGLGVMANAVRALDALGVGEAVRAYGHRITRADTFDVRGRCLIPIDTADHERRTGTPSLLMRRRDLHACLREALAGVTIRMNAELVGLNPGDGGGRATLRLASGEAPSTDLVIGADGWRSRVRRELWGEDAERDSGLVCWRGMAAGLRLARPHELAVIQGRGLQFGIGPLGPEEAYWFATFPTAIDRVGNDPSAAKEELARLFGGYPFDAAALVAATPVEAMLRTPLVDRRPLRRWSRQKATLVGDAAHPMLPTLGQGAATTLEDAVVLARALKAQPDMNAALGQYEALRIPRTTAIVGAAYALARLSRWGNPAATVLRDVALRATPPGILRQRTEEQLGYDAAAVTT